MEQDHWDGLMVWQNPGTVLEVNKMFHEEKTSRSQEPVLIELE